MTGLSAIFLRTETRSEWVLRMLNKGYRFRGVILSQALGGATCVLHKEITTLLKRAAMRCMLYDLSQRGFYSRYLLIPSLFAILDLRVLKELLGIYKFWIVTHASLLHFLLSGTWYTSIDLKEAYFHIPIISLSWAVPHVYLSQDVLLVPGPSLWFVIQPKDVYEVWVSCASTQ